MKLNKEYNKESKDYYLKMITEKFAYDLYLDRKFHNNNSVEIIWNTCINSGWIISNKEKEMIFKEAFDIANKKYNLQI